MTLTLFFIFAFIAIGSAVLVIVNKNPVYSAIFLILTLFCLAGIFLLLEAYFIAAVQVLVYAGAIMVLFLFVIMLLDLKSEEKLPRFLKIPAVAGALLAFVLVLEVFKMIGTGLNLKRLPAIPQTDVDIGGAIYIGEKLFTQYLFPFEIASILLLVALVGAVILAKRKVE